MLSWIFSARDESLKQSTDRHVAPHRHIILTLNQTVLALTP